MLRIKKTTNNTIHLSNGEQVKWEYLSNEIKATFIGETICTCYYDSFFDLCKDISEIM